jgi:hypothetical protein
VELDSILEALMMMEMWQMLLKLNRFLYSDHLFLATLLFEEVCQFFGFKRVLAIQLN